MVDCGLAPHKVGDKPWTGPDFSLLADGRKIDAVLITHVHADHVGFMPAIVPYLGPKARIWMTRTSETMIAHILEDSLKIYQREKIAGPYSRTQYELAMQRVQTLGRPGPVEILPGLKVLFHPAGHIPGACSYTFRVGRSHIHYSGDRCEHDQPGVLGATPLPRDWRRNIILAGTDCTYGAEPDSDQRFWMDEMDRCETLIREAMYRGKPTLIFTFGVHRGGAIAHELARRGVADETRVYLDGSCRTLSRSMRNAKSFWSPNETLVDFGQVQEIAKHSDRVEAISWGGPYVVIASPGMGGPGGAAMFWRKRILEDPGALAMFTGFVAPDTDGSRIKKAADGGVKTLELASINFDGTRSKETITVACQVEQVRLGAHQSRTTILDSIRELQPSAVVLNHGSEAALESLRAELSTDLSCDFYPTHVSPDVEIDL
jgi:Cft2 family RNA processing exonuclease